MDEYISREAVCYQLEKQESIDGQPRAIRRARRIVANSPAADVRPVVLGKWVRNKNNGLCYCSECDAPAPVEDVHGETISDAPYCYRCGADMRDG